MKTNTRYLYLGTMLAFFAGANLAISQTFNELPIPAAAGYSTPSANSLSELDPNNVDDFGTPGFCYAAGSCSVYPLIFQPGSLSSTATAWTTVPLVDDLGDPTGNSGVRFPNWHSPAAPLPPVFPIGVNHSAGYANATGVALSGVPARPSVRVGYTPLHFFTPADPINALRFRATSWVPDGAGGYVPQDLDKTDKYVSSRANGVVQGDDVGGTILACGQAYTQGANNLIGQELPVFWSLNPNGTPATGPTALPPLLAKRNAYPYAADRFTALGTTFVGEGSGQIGAVSSTWALFWREPFPPGQANNAPLNLNNPAVTDLGSLPTPGNKLGQCIGGVAYAVASYPIPPPGVGTLDVVVGQVTLRGNFTVRNRTFPTLIKKAFVWFSSDGGLTFEGDFVFPADELNNNNNNAPTLVNSVARSVSIVNGVPKIVGQVQSGTSSSGFIADPLAANNLSGWTSENFALDVNSSPAGRWSVIDMKAINRAGVILATERLRQSFIDRQVMLIPNPNNFDFLTLFFDGSGFYNSYPPNL